MVDTLNFRFLPLAISLAFSLLVVSTANAAPDIDRPTLIIPSSVRVQGEQLTLQELGKVYSNSEDSRELVEKLKAIVIGEAPAPGSQLTVLGEKVLETIEFAGIARSDLGYSIPKVIIVEREGRAVSKEEVQRAVRDAISADAKLDVQVREVEWRGTQIIPLGDTQVKATVIGKSGSGKIPVQIEVFVRDKAAARFSGTAVVDDWRAVPVINRTLSRGMLIHSDDLQLVRMNLSTQPGDVVDSLDQAIGRRLKNQLSAGETIRKSEIDIPPTIPKGKVVKMTYQVKSLMATATGVALDDGFESGVIRVQNETSKRVVQGIVINADEVKVQSK